MGGGGMGGGGMGGGGIGGGGIGGGGMGGVNVGVDKLTLMSVADIAETSDTDDGEGETDGDQHFFTLSTTKLSSICSFSFNNVRTLRLASIRSLRTILSVRPRSSLSNTLSTTMMS